MASLLKLIVDFPCQVYIDNELKGSVEQDKIFKLPLRKGTYILELKYADILLYEQEYRMESNEEEDLLRININEEDKEKAKEKRFWEISSMNVSIKEDEKGLFEGKGLYLVNNDTGEEYIIDYYRDDELAYNVIYDKEFDACGLLRIKVIRDAVGMDYTFLLNKIGQIQVRGYENIVPFSNIKATVAYEIDSFPLGNRENKYWIIDKWGNEIDYPKKFDWVDHDGFFGNFCAASVKRRDEFGQLIASEGLIDSAGNIIEECVHSNIDHISAYRYGNQVEIKYVVDRSKVIDSDGSVLYEGEQNGDIDVFYEEDKDDAGELISRNYKFIIRKDNKYGILNSRCKVILDCVYDSLEYLGDTYFWFERDGEIGVLDRKFNLVQLDFEILKDLKKGKCLIKKNNKYGVAHIHVDNGSLKINYIVPCKYEIHKYNEYYSSNCGVLHYFMKKQKDDGFTCDVYNFEYLTGDYKITKTKSFICQDIDIYLSREDKFVIQKDGKWGVVDKTECIYEEIKTPHEVKDILVKENGKWGILYRTDCIFDNILCYYGGHFGVIWTENNKKYIGYIDNVGFYKKEVEKSEILTNFELYARQKPVIFTVVDDGKIDPKNNYYGVPRKVYVCRKAVNCNKPEELVSIDYALTCNKIWSLSNGNDGEKEDEVGVEIKINGRNFFHDHVYGVFSFKTLSFVKECNNIWGAYDSEWYIKYNQLSGKEVLYYKNKLVSENDYIMVVYSKGFDNSIIAEQSEGSKWALFDENHIQLSMPIFTEFDVDEDFNINRLSFNKSKKDISEWEFFISDLSKIRYVFPFFKYRFHDGRGNSKDISPFKNIRTFIDVLPRTVIAEPTNSALIEKSTIDRVAFIVEDDNIGMLTMREFIVGDGDGAKNQMNNKAFKPEIINNKTYEDFISYLDIMLEESDYIIGVNTNNVLETIRKDIKRVKGASDSLYNGKNTDVLDLGRIKDLRMFETQKEINMIDWVNKIRECYNKQR